MKKTTPQNTPWIKICGLTDPENALGCANLGADAIGLVFFEKSPRNVSVKKAAQISSILPDHVLTIGVFVNESYDNIMEKVRQCALKGVQLHGNEPPALAHGLLKENLIVIKTLFATKAPFLTQASAYPNISFFLVEYGKGILPGGNAESWNYELSLQLKTKTPVVLAGGLDSDNICQAIRTANPIGVDVSSGVEKTYGIKDLKKVNSFITQIRSMS
ncbi:MAG: phosphoribosylanthranilate isomerase [Proteobacteria bacterium]|nr:phosphoribosylanthranilate isomerase [Pseudomonadota bacterium]MBU1585338.1 phosphoribosylanthranilate isomerase [Pseudomonadota bacterium]MBU2453089.1 phosphoribosylanthranilate isomerase [Pseudomonadota bacterium]MBU2631239.1 phosphoribosylanthranilate isomerase [Pseudomonadota bacterium]